MELSLEEYLQKEYPNKRGEQTRQESSTEKRERWMLGMLKKRESLERQGIKTNVLDIKVARELKTNPELYKDEFYKVKEKDSKGKTITVTYTRTWYIVRNLRKQSKEK